VNTKAKGGDFRGRKVREGGHEKRNLKTRALSAREDENGKNEYAVAHSELAGESSVQRGKEERPGLSHETRCNPHVRGKKERSSSYAARRE